MAIACAARGCIVRYDTPIDATHQKAPLVDRIVDDLVLCLALAGAELPTNRGVPDSNDKSLLSRVSRVGDHGRPAGQQRAVGKLGKGLRASALIPTGVRRKRTGSVTLPCRST